MAKLTPKYPLPPVISTFFLFKFIFFLFKIIKDNAEKHPNSFNHTTITTQNSFYSNNQLNKIYKREQYEYQKNNVDWMIQHEFNIANNKSYDTKYNRPDDKQISLF